MHIRGLRHIALGIVLCLGAVGCSHKNKGVGVDGAYGASTNGAGEGSVFAGADDGGLNAPRKVYFGFDRSDLSESDYMLIQAHAEYLRNHPDCHIRVEGHTDEQGSREYNVGLGERRADTVANALVSQGVSRHQIAVVSFGKEKPDVEGHSEDCYRLNRRAVIVYEN